MESQVYNRTSFVDFVERSAELAPARSVTSYAAGSFLSTLRTSGFTDVSSDFLRFWTASMLMNGMRPSTSRRYMGRIHSMFGEWRDGATGADPFPDSVAALLTSYESNSVEAAENLSLLPRLIGKSERSADFSTIELFLYLLYDPSQTILDAASLTFDIAEPFCPQIDDIIDHRPRRNSRKYVFSLSQGKTSLKHLSHLATESLSTLLRGVGMKFSKGFSRDSITSMWIVAAMKCGVTLPDIRSVIAGIPSDFPSLSLLRKNEISESRRREIICQVANAINDNAMRWFVMRLRQGVGVEDVKARIKDTLPGRLENMLFFAPTREEVRKENKKIIREQVPVIPGLLFFKTQKVKVKSLFAAIGDLAWCYRVNASPGSDYSVISNSQMAMFQRCVGQFTPDTRVDLVEVDTPLEIGRKVRITGGMMEGYEGEILDVKKEKGERIFFLKITNTTRAVWRANVEDVYIQPL